MADTSRRAFLKVGVLGAAAGVAAACATPPAPAPVSGPAPAGTIPPEAPTATAQPAVAAAAPTPEPTVPAATPTAPMGSVPVSPANRSLVVLQLSGGNDGLNVVVPYGDGLYYQLRPQVAIAQDQVLHLDDRVGLHPNLKAFKALYDRGQLAVLQGVGYPNPNRSHFRSMEIWHTAKPDGPVPDRGWLGSFMAEVYKVGESPFQCVNFGSSVPEALFTDRAPVAALQDMSTFQFLVDRKLPYMRDPLLKTFGQVYAKPARKLPALELVANTWDETTRGVDVLRGATEKYQPGAPYPNSPFAKTMQQVAQLLAADVGTRVFYVSLGGFDTHANEKPAHASLMTQIGDTLAAFMADVEHLGKADQVAVMAFSEFGRRVKENGSSGTDHGAAGPMFLLGKGIKGGLYGDHPDLQNLEDGDLRHTIDFRSVYATVIEDWLGAPSQDVLGGRFDRLGFVA